MRRAGDRECAALQDGSALMPMPDWDDLRLFLAVARAGGLSRAARQLRVDQTTVARRLATLEETLSTRLADRTPRGVHLTDAGHALLARAERIEAQVLAALRDGVARIPDMVPRIYAGLDTRLHGAAGLSLLAHLIQLVREGRVVTDAQPNLRAAFRLAGR